MTDEDRNTTTRSIVRKDLDDLDTTDGSRAGHYSREEVLEACNAEEGGQHE